MPAKLAELKDILYSGSLAYGPWGKAFEDQLKSFIGNPRIAVVNSYNSAMLVVLTVFGVMPGDEIIASPMSCLASNQPFATLHAKLVWADIDPAIGTLCPDSVRKRITRKTKVISHNHHCGYPGYIDEINAIGMEKGIFVVDDAIEAFGSEYKGKRIGNTDADATVYSFHTIRLPDTIDGGAFSFKDAGHFRKAKRVRDYGINRVFFRDALGEISEGCDIAEPGYGATLNEICSYIGFMQMEHLDGLLKRQRRNAEAWKSKIIRDYPDYSAIGKSSDNPNYWIFGVRAPNKRKAIRHFREKGYYASGVHLPNSRYSVFGESVHLPGVEEFYARFVALPCGWWM